MKKIWTHAAENMVGLSGRTHGSALLGGDLPYASAPASNTYYPEDDYKIGPRDTLAVMVFQETDLGQAAVQVDQKGNVLLPLIGQMKAENKTSTQLATEIRSEFGAKYLGYPQVSVIVTQSVSQHVTVNGSAWRVDGSSSTGRLQLRGNALKAFRGGGAVGNWS